MISRSGNRMRIERNAMSRCIKDSAMSACAPSRSRTGRASARSSSACSSSTRAAAASPSAWTTASSASWSPPDGGEGVAFFGWEVPDAAAVDAYAARLEQAGVAVTRGTRALADERRVADLIAFDDPVGNRLEIFHGAEIASEPFKPGRNISGFRTGTLGMGHAVLHVKSIHDVIPFYRDVLGFRLSDYMTRPFNAYFFHANPRHHSIAFIETGRNATHHLMMRALQSRRRRPVLRPRARRGRPHRRHARPPHQRRGDLVLFQHAVGLHGRVRLGRPRHRRRQLAAGGGDLGPEHVGPRPHVDAAGRPRRGAQAPHRRRRDRACASRST